MHVVPHPRGWAVKKEGARRASAVFPTQREAEQYGRNLARRERVEFVLHRRDGQIRDKDSYGNDPNPPRDREH